MTMKHSTGTKPRVLPVTKKQLCITLGLISRKGKCYYDRLRKDYITDDLLQKANFSPERYHGISILPLHVTKVILEELDIQIDEIYSL